MDQCWETSFLFSCFKHVLGNLFAVILERLSFLLQSCVVHCFVIRSCAYFLGCLVNQLFYIFEHLFILVDDHLLKILSFCVFVSIGDVAFLFKRGTYFARRVWKHCPVCNVVPRYFLPKTLCLSDGGYKREKTR